MRLSELKVEQINSNNEVITDYSEILSSNELNQIILENFKDTYYDNGQICGRFDKYNYAIYSKNISYLGIPHPVFKKRIQIPSNFLKIYDDNANINIQTLLIGVYKYRDVLLFCDFDTKTYVNNKLNNSSAHVSTLDLSKGLELGFFQKRDKKGNDITIFTCDHILEYFEYKFNHTEIECKMEIVNTFDKFFDSVAKDWFGIECYKEMIEANYNNKYQPEWAGFYLEYLLNEYIIDHHLYDIVRYEQNKTNDGVDLDLYFSKINSYGDLKAHSESSSAVLGNDLKTIEKLVQEGNVYYIVCNHDTVLDKNKDFVTTKYWNSVQNKDDNLSYSNKMKYEVHLKSYYILEINKNNYKYVDIYNQGVNSDGKPRNPKISISTKNFDNFLIHVVEFSEYN